MTTYQTVTEQVPYTYTVYQRVTETVQRPQTTWVCVPRTITQQVPVVTRVNTCASPCDTGMGGGYGGYGGSGG